jgi:hypothetical protein
MMTLMVGCGSSAQDGVDNSRADTEILPFNTIKQVTYDLVAEGAPADALKLLVLKLDSGFHFEVDAPKPASHDGTYQLVKQGSKQLIQFMKATTSSCTAANADTCADTYSFSFDAAQGLLTLTNEKQAGAQAFTMKVSKDAFCARKDDCGNQALDRGDCPTMTFRCSHNVCVGSCPSRFCQITQTDCAPDEICHIDPPADMCGFDGTTGVCEKRPDLCPAIAGLPVCGCDGTVFGNACEAERAGDPVAQVGSCGGAAGEGEKCGGLFAKGCLKGLFCSFTEQQNCGFGDQEGVCARHLGFFCPALFQPVCGCNGETFGNSCEAEVQGQSIRHDGSCARTSRVH